MSTETKKIEIANDLLQTIFQSSESNFYRNIWNNNALTIRSLPTITKQQISITPLHDRSYIKNRKGLVKVVKILPMRQFLIERTLHDLKKEQYGILNTRPVVLFSNSHEALEKAHWCYEQNTLPLIGEHANMVVCAFSIKRYGVDSFFGDSIMLKKLARQDPTGISKIKIFNIHGIFFDIIEIRKIIPKSAKIHFILSLPEAGAFASSCDISLQNDDLIFHPDKNSILEFSDNSLVITKLIFMPTPIIRYQVDNINVMEKHSCACGEKISFSI